MALSHVFPALLLLVVGTSADCPVGSVRGITPLSCYKLYTRPASYHDAQETCRRDSGYLVSISNRNVERDLRTLTTEYGSVTRYWVGATQTDGYGWSWTDGSPWYHPQWAADARWTSADCNELQSFICEVPDSTVYTPSAEPCLAGWTYIEQTGLCYKLSDDEMSWNNGSALCAKDGGNLVTIPSFEVNYRIMGAQNTQDIWIGYRRNATTNTWSWANGAKSTFTLWQFGSPDNIHGDCAALQGSAGGFWYNLGCEDEQAYVICERAPFDWHPNTV